MEIVDEKGKNVCYNFVRSISITLYEQNLTDSRLCYYLKAKALPQFVEDGSFVVSRQELASVMANEFKDLLSEHLSTDPETRPRKVNSVALLNKVLGYMPNLKMVRVRPSRERNYTRYSEMNGTIEIDYRVINAVIDPSAYMGEDVVEMMKGAFEEMGYLERTPFYCPNYVKIRANELNNALEPYLEGQSLPGPDPEGEEDEPEDENENGQSMEVDPFSIMKMLLTAKFVQDDTLLYFVVKE